MQMHGSFLLLTAGASEYLVSRSALASSESMPFKAASLYWRLVYFKVSLMVRSASRSISSLYWWILFESLSLARARSVSGLVLSNSPASLRHSSGSFAILSSSRLRPLGSFKQMRWRDRTGFQHGVLWNV